MSAALSAMTPGMLEVTGFRRPIGSGARVLASDGSVCRAEVIGFRGDRTLLVPLDADAPLENGIRVEPDSQANMVQVGDGSSAVSSTRWASRSTARGRSSRVASGR